MAVKYKMPSNAISYGATAQGAQL